VKISAAIPALVVAVMLLLRARAVGPDTRQRGVAVARVALVFALGWTGTAGYWYARNIVHTGNPLYPAKFLLWPGATFPETTLREYAGMYGAARALRDALAVYTSWPLVHALIAAAGLLGLGAWVARRRHALTRADGYFALGALGITAATLAALPGMPYSAGNAMTFRSGFVHWDSMRYVALLPLLGWIALAVLLARWRRGGAVAAVTVTIAALLASTRPGLASPIALVALAISARLVAALPRVTVRTRDVAASWLPRHCLVVVGLVVLVGAATVAPSHRTKAAATEAAILHEPLFGAAAAVLDAQRAGTRVAVFGDQWIYPAFGARHDLRPVRVDGDGRIASRPIGAAMGPGELLLDAATLRTNLVASGIGIVVVLKLPHPGRSSERPTQEAALAAIPDVKLLHRDAAATIWKIE
jgi:hypothetical protein